MQSRYRDRLASDARHHIWAGIASAIILVGAITGIIYSIAMRSAAVSYVIAPVQAGTIVKTVQISGQVEAKQQTDLKSSVSGTVSSVSVQAGQKVSKDQIVAKLDPSAAALDFQSAVIGYQKDAAPPARSDITASQGDLTKAYNDAYVAGFSAMSDLPKIISGMNDALYDQQGYVSDVATVNLDTTSRANVKKAGEAFDIARRAYNDNLSTYKTISTTSATSTLNTYVNDISNSVKDLSTALRLTNEAQQFIHTNYPEYNGSGYASLMNELPSWMSTIETDLSNLANAQTEISTASSSIAKLHEGAGPYVLQNDKNVISQKQLALSKYTIRAPYNGIVGRISVKANDQVSAGDNLLTIYSPQKDVTTSLDEIGAASVKPGQPVGITFDAIDGLTATGTITEVDNTATVSQDVVSYGAKTSLPINDPRIKPGMGVELSIETFRKSHVLVVPTTAIKKDPNGNPYVLVFGQPPLQVGTTTISTSEQPIQRSVTLGSADDTHTEITSGLSSGEYIVTKKISGS